MKDNSLAVPVESAIAGLFKGFIVDNGRDFKVEIVRFLLHVSDVCLIQPSSSLFNILIRDQIPHGNIELRLSAIT